MASADLKTTHDGMSLKHASPGMLCGMQECLKSFCNHEDKLAAMFNCMVIELAPPYLAKDLLQGLMSPKRKLCPVCIAYLIHRGWSPDSMSIQWIIRAQPLTRNAQ